jgi:hypothetical protein
MQSSFVPAEIELPVHAGRATFTSPLWKPSFHSPTGLRYKYGVVLIEGHMIEREQDVLLDPCGEVAQGHQHAGVPAVAPYVSEHGIEPGLTAP